MHNDNYIVTNLKMAGKLIDLGFLGSLIEVEGDSYHFENLPEIEQLVSEYTIPEQVISKILDDSGVDSVHAPQVIDVDSVKIDVDEPVVLNESVKPIQNKKLIKSRRIHKALIKKGFELLETKENPYNGKLEYYFADCDEISQAFAQIVTDFSKTKDEVSQIGFTEREKKMLYTLLCVKKEELITLGVKGFHMYANLNQLIDKVKSDG